VTDPTQRFSNRVDNYVKYRPGYPLAVIDLLTNECGLTSDSIIADVGSGTGILSELFLRNGNTVFGVEPNTAMREAGEKLLAQYSAFKSIEGGAEATTLPDQSVNLITAAQAFHWFDQKRAREEFARILKLNGWVALIWNERRLDSTPFLRAYEQMLLKFGTDYQQVRHENVYNDVAPFFAPHKFQVKAFENHQAFDFDGVKGRLLSASYVPAPGQTNFEAMLDEVRAIFDTNQEAGKIVFEYDTRVYFGQLWN
jgi:ubiquinone/menaquinone biosynthesis C-methylase UbiE